MIKLIKVIGIVGATFPYLFIVTSIVLSPWFSIYNNALSDLGSILRNGYAAYIFNLGVMMAGLFSISFNLLLSYVKRSWKFLLWTPLFTVSSISLFLIGVFNEDAGGIHGTVSVIFFLAAVVTMLVYSFLSWPLGTPKIGALSLVFGITCAIIWFEQWPWHGIAIQETATIIMASIWLILVSLKNV
jgi:hypothetical membrane protein